MTAVTTDQSHLSTLPPAQGRANLLGTLRSEITKIRSVRSTYWTMIVLFVVTVGISALITWLTASHWDQASLSQRATFQPARNSLIGLYFGQFVIVVLGALTFTAEYSTGMIRTSLTAMPRRGVFYLAKALVFAVAALIIGEVASFVAFFLGQALLNTAPEHISTTLGAPHVLRAVVGGGLFIVACGLLAFGIGSLVRHTAAAISITIGVLFVVPIIVNFLPTSWSNDIMRWLPSEGGTAIWNTAQQAHEWPAWGEFSVLLGYTAAVLIAGYILFRRRDA
ncbi:MAG: ABC transporter permease subunit [Actinobacteria bacterium]|nr:ABC transporter permease subunit [Actinomycetota bacterium]